MTVRFVLLLFVLSIMIFTMIYAVLPAGSYYRSSQGRATSITFDEALMLSVSTQTLLGQADLVPIRTGPRLWMMLQTVTAPFLLFYVMINVINDPLRQ